MPKAKKTKDAFELEAPHFNHAKTRFIVDALIIQKLAGKKADSGFKSEAWNTVVTDYNQTFKCNLTKGQIKNNFQTLKKAYVIFHKLRSTSGVGWDEDSGMVITEPGFWAIYAPKNKGSSIYETKPFPLWKLMNELCGDTNAAADGIIGTQTQPNPVQDPSIDPDLAKALANKSFSEDDLNHDDVDSNHDDQDSTRDDHDEFFGLPPSIVRANRSQATLDTANPGNSLGLGQFDPAHQASDHSGSETDEPITQSQASTSMTAKIRGKKPAGRIRPNTKAKLAASLDSSVDSLKNQVSEAIKRERIRAQSIIDHDNAKVTILETAARLDQKLLTIKSSKAPSQPEAMALFTLSYKEHFSDVMAATSAIQLFENEDKCATFINSPPELRWTWLATALGYTVVNE